MEMNVNRRSTHPWWQGTFDSQDDLAGIIAHSAKPENFSRVPIL
jgi:hypothetical protein